VRWPGEGVRLRANGGTSADTPSGVESEGAERKRGREPIRAGDPTVVNIWSAVWMLSFSKTGNAVEWSSRPTFPQLAVQSVRDGHRFGIVLDHAEEARTVRVERLDPLDVHRGELPGRHLPNPQIRSGAGKRGTIQLRKSPEGTTRAEFEEIGLLMVVRGAWCAR
jgi:hypothetical protein